jgi:diguanylate cyclase (GGDEF)-like protein/PAS domain S-box-containing protein
MTIFDQNIGLIQLLIPAFCSGILIIGNIQYLYISLRRKDSLYISLTLVGFLSLLFVLSHLLNLIIGGIMIRPNAGMQIHRIEQLTATYLIFGLPYFLTHLLKLNEKWRRVNVILSYAGLAVSCMITVIAFASPDLFVSVTRHTGPWKTMAAFHGRGQEGIVYQVRDMIFGLLFVYAAVCFAADIIMNKSYRHLWMPMMGCLIAALAALDDVVYIHTGSFTGIFSDIVFARFTLGITVFIMLSIHELTRKFIGEASAAEQAYQELNSAYRVLHRSEERFQQFAESMHDIFMLYDINNNIMLYVSPAYEMITGLKLDNVYESPEKWFEYIHPDDRTNVIRSFRKENIGDRFELLFRFIRKDGATRWLRLQAMPARDRNNAVYRIACVIEDITDRKRSEDELTFIAYNDMLTGLPNRRSFFDLLQEFMVQAVREGPEKSKAVMIIDIDRFKDINDTFGHEFGDRLIRETAERLKLCLRESDHISRIGGDKFSVLLNKITEDIDAAVVARKISEVMFSPFIITSREIYINLRIGISIYPKDGADADVLVKNAEMALYAAKAQNAPFKFYSDEMDVRAHERLTLEKNLRHAIDRNQLSLHYQPLVNIQGKIIGMEALLRWDHPELGSVPPDKFIPIAESTGLIIDIGNWTIQSACRQKKSWEDMGYGDLKMSVNLSTKQLMDEELVAKITGILDEIGLNSRSLELEITETCLMEYPEIAISKINDLNNIGINFSIDDFGTGYSSLSYLKRFKIEHLKVDKSFIMDIKVDVNNAEITKAIIAMAHSLSLKVIAEGVETLEQLEFLKTYKCDYLQGFLFSRPVPAEDMTRILQSGTHIIITG